MALLEKITRWLVNLLALIGGVFLVGMITITCANILSRVLWEPIRGTFELMGYAGAIVTAFALGYTQIKKGHVAVDILVAKYSTRAKKVVHLINSFLCLLFFVIVAWQIAVKANILMKTGEVTETLQIIYYPFTYAVAFSCLVLALVLVVELIRPFVPEAKGKS